MSNQVAAEQSGTSGGMTALVHQQQSTVKGPDPPRPPQPTSLVQPGQQIDRLNPLVQSYYHPTYHVHNMGRNPLNSPSYPSTVRNQFQVYPSRTPQYSMVPALNQQLYFNSYINQPQTNSNGYYAHNAIPTRQQPQKSAKDFQFINPVTGKNVFEEVNGDHSSGATSKKEITMSNQVATEQSRTLGGMTASVHQQQSAAKGPDPPRPPQPTSLVQPGQQINRLNPLVQWTYPYPLNSPSYPSTVMNQFQVYPSRTPQYSMVPSLNQQLYFNSYINQPQTNSNGYYAHNAIPTRQQPQKSAKDFQVINPVTGKNVFEEVNGDHSSGATSKKEITMSNQVAAEQSGTSGGMIAPVQQHQSAVKGPDPPRPPQPTSLEQSGQQKNRVNPLVKLEETRRILIADDRKRIIRNLKAGLYSKFQCFPSSNAPTATVPAATTTKKRVKDLMIINPLTGTNIFEDAPAATTKKKVKDLVIINPLI